jgi:hypothetical protein
MSYDIYCFRPSSPTPSIEEAQAIVESDEDSERPEDESARETKQRVVEALKQHNPRLEQFEFDYAAIARRMKISEQEARERRKHVELNPPEGDPAIQITVSGKHVSISIPYWYTNAEAERVFRQLMDYLRVIKRAGGYWAFDPQKDRIFDPENEDLGEHASYEKIVRDLPAMVAKAAKQRDGDPNKPWWKFW